jgi:Na+-translocating ferredoxin:NAD+ oxidoreductase RnfD subunit
MTAGRFLRTPKGLLLVLLVILIGIAAPREGLAQVAPGLFAAMLVAGAIDGVILRVRHGYWEFPDGALLSAMLVAMVLSAQQPWHYAAVTAAVAVVSKYVLRSRAGNVFNPAALALVATSHLFHTGQSWWGALPNVAPWAQLAVVVAGVVIADRVNKMPLVVAFLGSYFALFTVAAFVTSPAQLAEIFRTPDLQAAFFFAVFILTDPPTSPVRYPDQIVCSAIVAVVSFAVFMWIGAVYYLLAGVLAGNVWEAWRRISHRTGARFPGGMAEFLRELTPWRRPARPQVARCHLFRPGDSLQWELP